jgi:hypothetical protein
MDRWDLVFIGVAVYVAVASLVRLMAARRDEVIRQFRAEVERLQAQRAAEAEEERDAA